VRLPKRHPPLRQVIGQVGGRDQRVAGGGREALRAPGGPAQHGRRQRQPVVHQVDGVKVRGLVLLEVAVVAHRQALEHHQQRHERAVDAPRFAPQQLGHVRIPLLGHDARAGGVRLVERNEAEFGARPQHQLLRQPRQVHGQGGQRRQVLDQKVAIGHRVQAVAADAREAQQARHVLPVEGIRRAGQRTGAERQHVDARVRVAQAPGVALQHLPVGEQVVPERHRLGALQMGVAGHDRRPERIRDADQRRLQLDDGRAALDQGRSHEQAGVGGDLVVATARRVQSARRLADARGQLRLHHAVDVLVGAVQRRWLLQQPGQSGHQRRGVGLGDDALAPEHASVGNAAQHVPFEQPFVDGQRRRVGQRAFVERFAEAAAPQGRANRRAPRRCSGPPAVGFPARCRRQAGCAPACAGPG
jgi:hypothetical protein